MILGAYYFSGWWAPDAVGMRERLLEEFPDREPVWGWVSDGPANMEVQIDLATDGGLDFFAFDWYFPEISERELALNLNACVDDFLLAKNNDKMRFCLLVANHDAFRIFRDGWEKAVDYWIPFLKSERAVTIGGKPLIIFFAALTECLGGSAAVRECTDYFRNKAKEAGLPDIFIASCVYPKTENTGEQLEIGQAEGYDGFTGYNYIQGYHYEGPEPYIHPYGELAECHMSAWDRFAKDSPLPYMPIVTCGWDCRGWEKPGAPPRSWYYPDRTPKQVYEFVSAAGDWMENNPSKTVEEKAVLLYAWNEYGEGGYIAPTKWDSGAYLDAVGRAKRDRA